jgi:hypothetical protein
MKESYFHAKRKDETCTVKANSTNGTQQIIIKEDYPHISDGSLRKYNSEFGVSWVQQSQEGTRHLIYF